MRANATITQSENLNGTNSGNMQVTVKLRRQSVLHQPPRFPLRFRVIILPCNVHYPSIIREIPSDPVPSASSIDPLLCLHPETMSLHENKRFVMDFVFFYFRAWKIYDSTFPRTAGCFSSWHLKPHPVSIGFESTSIGVLSLKRIIEMSYLI